MPPSVVTVVSDAPPTDAPSDGSRLRSQESRRKIVQALMELVRDGQLEPSAEVVAERAGVGLRSVFRHFKDMEGLRREMSEIVEGELRELVDRPFAGATWRDHLTDVVHRRAEVFERVMPYRRAGSLQAHRSSFLQSNKARVNHTLRVTLRAILPEALATDATLFEALDLTLSFESWIRLRHDQALTPDDARRVWERTVRALIAEAEDPTTP